MRIFHPNQVGPKHAIKLSLACCLRCHSKCSHPHSHLTQQFPPTCFHLFKCASSYTAAAATFCDSSSSFYCMLITASFVTCPLKGSPSSYSDWEGRKPRASNVHCGCGQEMREREAPRRPMQFSSEAESDFFFFFLTPEMFGFSGLQPKRLKPSLRTSTVQGDEPSHVEERGDQVQLSIGPMECLLCHERCQQTFLYIILSHYFLQYKDSG